MGKKLHRFAHSLVSLTVFFAAGAGVALTVDALQAAVSVEPSAAEIVPKIIEPVWEVDFSGTQIVAKNEAIVAGSDRPVTYEAITPQPLRWERHDPGALFWDDATGEYRIGTAW